MQLKQFSWCFGWGKCFNSCGNFIFFVSLLWKRKSMTCINKEESSTKVGGGGDISAQDRIVYIIISRESELGVWYNKCYTYIIVWLNLCHHHMGLQISYASHTTLLSQVFDWMNQWILTHEFLKNAWQVFDWRNEWILTHEFLKNAWQVVVDFCLYFVIGKVIMVTKLCFFYKFEKCANQG